MTALARTKPPFRADHVGSLLRPQKLTHAREKWTEDKLPETELKAVEDECVRAAVALQEGVGLKGITDGDYRRNDWFTDFIFAIDGIERSGAYAAVPFSGGITYDAELTKVSGKVRYPKTGIGRNAFSFLKSATKQTAKIAIPAPAMLYTFIERDVVDRASYPDMADFWRDLGSAYNAALKDYASLGCTYLQIDDVNTPDLPDETWKGFWRARGYDAENMVDRFIAVNNAAIADRPANMTVCVHMCRGNYQSEYTGSGSYDEIADRYFNQMAVDGFFLEYDDERSGDFTPLRFMPKNKMVVLGLITTKRPALENKDEIKRRIDEASKYVPIDRLALSPQCGFASTHHGNRLTEDDQRRKLEHLVAIAEEVWGGV